MASLIPKSVKQAIVNKWIDANEEWWLMLMKTTFVPSADHVNISDVVPATNEITDDKGVYPAGGIKVTGRVVTQQGSQNAYYLAATNVSVGPSADLNFGYGVLYTKTGGTGQATYAIRAEIDFGGAQVVTNGTSTIIWNALGIILVS